MRVCYLLWQLIHSPLFHYVPQVHFLVSKNKTRVLKVNIFNIAQNITLASGSQPYQVNSKAETRRQMTANEFTFIHIMIVITDNNNNNNKIKKKYLQTCRPSEDSNQTAHSRNLIEIFTGRTLVSMHRLI